MIACKICGKEYYNKQCLSRHIKTHNISYKDYYDKFLKTENEGICPVCHKETRWHRSEYYHHCSTRCSTLDPQVKQKIMNTSMLIYGVEHASKLPETSIKRIQTNIEKYGVEYPMQNQDVWDKQKQTMIETYGVDNIFKSDVHINKNRDELYKKTYDSLMTRCENTIPNFEFIDYEGSGTPKVYSWKCLKCSNIFERRYFEGKMPLCPKCFPTVQSIGQVELYKFLVEDLKQVVIENSRMLISPQEVDLYIRSANIAIEYDGNYWHSESNGKGRKYHIEKTNECNKKSVRLIHIFEDEWINKGDIVKSRLRNLFQLNKYKIYARKCEIREIPTKQKVNFLNKYHIQGSDKSNIKLGAFYKNRLVSVMTFSNLRSALGNKSKVDEYELSRFCTIRNFSCIGIAGKLLKYFEQNYSYTRIISYADIKWSNDGAFYTQIGFTKKHTSPPSYYYIHKSDYLTRMHRYSFRKNILSTKLKIYDPNKTEWENMKDNGYDRIWDCGSIVYEKIKK